MLQLLGTSCWYRDNCITKLWAHCSYFLYLYMVFFQHSFHSEQHFFHLDRQFSCFSNIPNWLSRVLKSIQSSHTELLFHRIPCTLSDTKRENLEHELHGWIYDRIKNVSDPNSNLCYLMKMCVSSLSQHEFFRVNLNDMRYLICTIFLTDYIPC